MIKTREKARRIKPGVAKRPLRDVHKKPKAARIARVPLRITKPVEANWCKFMVFSPPGHGKTTLLGTAQEDPRTAPCLFVDFESGIQSLAGLDIDVARIRSWEDYNDLYAILTAPDCPYKSVAIDSISETNVFALLRVLDEDAKRPDVDLAGQQDYGKVGVQMRRLIRHFRDLEMHVFVASGAKDDVEARVGTIKKPALIGQMADEIPGIMDTVGYLAKVQGGEEEDGEEQRVLILHGYPKFRTKARTPWKKTVPQEIEDPTITRVLDALGFKK